MKTTKTKFVNYEKYCKICKFKDVDDAKGEEPCSRCLSIPVNLFSNKPVCYEKDETVNNKKGNDK